MEIFKQNKNNKVSDLENSFYNSEMTLQDQLATPFVNQTLPPVDPSFTPSASFQNLLNEVRKQRGALVPVTNPYLGYRTPEQYAEYTNEDLQFGNLLPGIQKVLGSRAGARAVKFGEQLIDNVPGLSAIGQKPGTQKDPTTEWAVSAIQAGGTVLPLFGAAWLGLNAGPTGAGTLEDARKRGFYR